MTSPTLTPPVPAGGASTGPAGALAPPIRVLVVDDSVVVRGVFGRLLDAEADITVVTTAPNGRAALAALAQVAIDVVLLDVEMPELDGLEALPQMLASHPQVRVLMASSLTAAGAEVTMRALALGASDFVHKPSARGTSVVSGIEALRTDLLRKVRALGRASAPARTRTLSPAAPPAVVQTAILADRTPRVLGLFSSTGGPNALVAVLKSLRHPLPIPVVVVQHMPPLFTALLAQRLGRDTGHPAKEATDGERLLAGTVYLAPGDRHLVVDTVDGVPIARLSDAEPEHFCRPAADPTLRSLARVYGSAAIAVVLTGMGNDSALGARDLRAAGGRVLAQDEATSVVWGMPGAVVAAGAATDVLPLDEIAPRLTTWMAEGRA